LSILSNVGLRLILGLFPIMRTFQSKYLIPDEEIKG